MPQTLTYQCPHCGRPMEVELQSGKEVLTCPSEECHKPFQVQLPIAQPTPSLVVPPDLDGTPQDQAAPAVAQSAAAPEAELIQVKPVMFRRYPLRYIGYVALALAGVIVLLYALIYHRPIIGVLAFAAGAFGAVRLLMWWLRVNSTTLTVTTRRIVLRTGVLSPQTVEIPHAEVSDIQVRQDFANRLLGVGDLSITTNGADKTGIVVLAVPKVDAVVTHIRNHRPAAAPQPN